MVTEPYAYFGVDGGIGPSGIFRYCCVIKKDVVIYFMLCGELKRP